MSDLNEQLRAEFEAWAVEDTGGNWEADPELFERNGNTYKHLGLRGDWRAYRAGAARRAPAAAPAPVAASLNAVKLSDVIEAIRVVNKEAARRGEMYPQHAEEQREDRAAVQNVVAKLLFYGGQGCEKWAEWPKFSVTPAPAAAPIVQPVGDVWPLIDAYADMRANYEHSSARHLFASQREYMEAAKAELIAALQAPIVQAEPVRRKFFDLPLGTRFRYIGGKDEWVVLERHGRGLVAGYQPYDGWVAGQSIFTFADSEAECRALEVEVITAPTSTAADAKDAARVHGHRDPYYLLANCRRRLLTHPKWKAAPNWVIAMELFATGSTSAWEICREAGIDGDSTTVARAAIATSADEVKS